jgi:hypothetical protein
MCGLAVMWTKRLSDANPAPSETLQFRYGDVHVHLAKGCSDLHLYSRVLSRFGIVDELLKDDTALILSTDTNTVDIFTDLEELDLCQILAGVDVSEEVVLYCGQNDVSEKRPCSQDCKWHLVLVVGKHGELLFSTLPVNKKLYRPAEPDDVDDEDFLVFENMFRAMHSQKLNSTGINFVVASKHCYGLLRLA